MAPSPVVVASTIALTKFDCSVSERDSAALAPSDVATACWNVDRFVSAPDAADAEVMVAAPVKVVKAASTEDWLERVSAAELVSARKVLAADAADSRLVPL